MLERSSFKLANLKKISKFDIFRIIGIMGIVAIITIDAKLERTKPMKSMEKVTAAEFQNKFGEYTAKAERKPVAITKHGKPRLIVLSVEDFMQMLRRTQKSVHVSELTDEQFEAIMSAEAPKENDYLNKLLEE